MAQPLVVIGGSAGALEPLRTLLSGLPGDLAAPVVVVLHTPATSHSRLARLLGHSTRLAVETADQGARLAPGHVLVAPADEHTLVQDGAITLSHAPRENGVRPAIDPLFRSAARSHGRGVIGIVLCGMLDDGSAGLAIVRAHGGIGVVQEPGSCDFPDMPENAIKAADPQHVVPVDRMAGLIVTLVEEARMDESQPSTPFPSTDEVPSKDPNEFGCPDCGGVLSKLEVEGLTEYRCRVGHRYSEESLFEAQASAYESAIWAAVRALEEQASLARDLHDRAHARGDSRTALRFAQRATAARDHAGIIRDRLLTAPERVEAGA